MPRKTDFLFYFCVFKVLSHYFVIGMLYYLIIQRRGHPYGLINQ